MLTAEQLAAIDAFAGKLAAEAPPLTAEQQDLIARIFARRRPAQRPAAQAA